MIDYHDDFRDKRLRDDADYAREYEFLTPRFEVIRDIVRLRNAREMTQEELAERAGTHQSQVSRLESGEHDIRLSTIVKIARALEAKTLLNVVPKEQAALFDWAFEFGSRIGSEDMPSMRLEGFAGMANLSDHDTVTFLTDKGTYRVVGESAGAKAEMKEMKSPWEPNVAA